MLHLLHFTLAHSQYLMLFLENNVILKGDSAVSTPILL